MQDAPKCDVLGFNNIFQTCERDVRDFSSPFNIHLGNDFFAWS